MRKLFLAVLFLGTFILYANDTNSTEQEATEQTIEEQGVADTPQKKMFVSPDDEEFKKKIENMKNIGEITEG